MAAQEDYDMAFPKGGKHSDETKAKIAAGVGAHHTQVRRDTLIVTGQGRRRETASVPPREVAPIEKE